MVLSGIGSGRRVSNLPCPQAVGTTTRPTQLSRTLPKCSLVRLATARHLRLIK